MKKINLLITIIFVIGYVLPALGQGNFNTSLHKTRHGKPTWYDVPNGFETLTNVPISGLGCVECHDANDANGDPYPATGYEPGCVDCHATNTTGWPVTQADCLGCHSREASIIMYSRAITWGTIFPLCFFSRAFSFIYGIMQPCL